KMLSMDWNILIVFLLIFINKVYNIRDVYIELLPCPNCEEWCANDPIYTCDYTCEMLEIDDKIEHMESNYFINEESVTKKKGTILVSASMTNKDRHFRTRHMRTMDETNEDWHCTRDFEPFHKGMERCCQIMKNCVESKSSTILTEEFLQYCGMQCIDGKLKTIETTTLKPTTLTTKMTKKSTIKKKVTTKKNKFTRKTLTSTTKSDNNNKAIYKGKKGGFSKFNFMIIGALIFAVFGYFV
ncbi:hypothetical protein Mgra_00007871, partial [Meloidogyne graminicola]